MSAPSRTAWFLWKASIAFVWFHQGLWHKVLSGDGRHRRIMTEALGETLGPAACIALGLFEAALGIAVLAEFRPKLTAITQIMLLAGMNAAGLLLAGGSIPDPAGMLVMNFAFALSVWMQGLLATARKS